MDEHVISIYYTYEHGRNIKWAKGNIVENLMVIFSPPKHQNGQFEYGI